MDPRHKSQSKVDKLMLYTKIQGKWFLSYCATNEFFSFL
jgi:hypothetical protein